MKTLLPCSWTCSFVALPLLGLAGGNSSIVEIDKVTEIKVEEKKITIKGSAVIKRRVMSTAEKGETTGGHTAEDLKRQSDKWWAVTHADAAKIKKGDAVTIGYQGDQTTINGVRVTGIVGYGSVLVNGERGR